MKWKSTMEIYPMLDGIFRTDTPESSTGHIFPKNAQLRTLVWQLLKSIRIEAVCYRLPWWELIYDTTVSCRIRSNITPNGKKCLFVQSLFNIWSDHAWNSCVTSSILTPSLLVSSMRQPIWFCPTNDDGLGSWNKNYFDKFLMLWRIFWHILRCLSFTRSKYYCAVATNNCVALSIQTNKYSQADVTEDQSEMTASS